MLPHGCRCGVETRGQGYEESNHEKYADYVFVALFCVSLVIYKVDTCNKHN